MFLSQTDILHTLPNGTQVKHLCNPALLQFSQNDDLFYRVSVGNFFLNLFFLEQDCPQQMCNSEQTAYMSGITPRGSGGGDCAGLSEAEQTTCLLSFCKDVYVDFVVCNSNECEGAGN